MAHHIFDVSMGPQGPVVKAVGTITGRPGTPIQFSTVRLLVMQITGLPMFLEGDVGDTTALQPLVLDIAAGTMPVGPWGLQIDFSVVDADNPMEAELYANGKFVEHLWPMGNSRANNSTSVQRVFIPGAMLVEGTNSLEFDLIKSGKGFSILDNPPPVLTILLDTPNQNVPPLFIQAADAFTKLSQEL